MRQASNIWKMLDDMHANNPAVRQTLLGSHTFIGVPQVHRQADEGGRRNYGEGEKSQYGGDSGDLFIVVNILKHKFLVI